jgi:hypothetical protein
MSPSSTVLSRDVESLDTMAWRTRGSSWRLAMAAATKMTSVASPAAMRRRRGEKSADADAVCRGRSAGALWTAVSIVRKWSWSRKSRSVIATALGYESSGLRAVL